MGIVCLLLKIEEQEKTEEKVQGGLQMTDLKKKILDYILKESKECAEKLEGKDEADLTFYKGKLAVIKEVKKIVMSNGLKDVNREEWKKWEVKL